MPRVTYTASVNVPVYANWKCEKCGSINLSKGRIHVAQTESSVAIRESKQNAAKERAISAVEETWAEEALQIITEFNKTPQMRNEISLSSSCSKCKAKPEWAGPKGKWLYSLLVPVAIVGMFLFIAEEYLLFFVALCIGLGMIFTAKVCEFGYETKVSNLPEKYKPVMGSVNGNLVEYAKAHGKTIPTPEVCLRTVLLYAQSENTSAPEA